MERVAIYCRLSDEDRNKKNESDESESIQNQKTMLINYCVEKGWDIYNIYCDEDYSGADRNRPDFNRMIKDCEKGVIDLVLCKTQSRFSRDMEIIERYVHGKFLEWNVHFLGLVDYADTRIEGNKKARQINGLVNEWYLEDLSNNIKRTLKSKHKNGEYTGSFAPYGYSIDSENKNHLIIDPVASKIVKDIFNMYIQGFGYIKIAKTLNDMQVPNPTFYKNQNGSKYKNAQYEKKTIKSRLWTESTIYRIVRREVYLGVLVQEKSENISYKSKKRRYKPEIEWNKTINAHEPIISREIWEKTLELRSQKGRCEKFTGEIYLFSKKIYCSECKSTMWKMSYQLSDGRYNYLRCRTVKISSDKCSNKASVRLDMLEKVVLDEINNLLEEFYTPKLIKMEELNDNMQEKKDLEINLKNLQNSKTKKENHLAKLYEDKLDETISKSQFLSFNKRFVNEIKDLEKNIKSVTEKIDFLNDEKTKDRNRDRILKKYRHIEKLDRMLVDEFIDSIYVGKTDENGKREININWKI